MPPLPMLQGSLFHLSHLEADGLIAVLFDTGATFSALTGFSRSSKEHSQNQEKHDVYRENHRSYFIIHQEC